MLKDIIIVGAGGCGREVVNWINDINDVHPTWNILGFIDDNQQALDNYQCRYEIIDGIANHNPIDSAFYAMGIAAPRAKRKVGQMLLKRGAHFASIIHPTTRVYTENKLGIGLVTYPNAKIGTGCKIGNFVTLQSTILGHDAELHDYVTVSSNCGVTGGVVIHEGSFIADHAAIAVGIEVGENSYVGIGSIVIKDIPANVKVFGNPARVYAQNE